MTSGIEETQKQADMIHKHFETTNKVCPECGTLLISKRSQQQNKYFHKILQIWGSEIGYDLEEIKCIVKKELGLFRMAKDRNGIEFIVYESSSRWNKEKFARVIDWIIRTAGEQGTHLQSPEEFYGEFNQAL